MIAANGPPDFGSLILMGKHSPEVSKAIQKEVSRLSQDELDQLLADGAKKLGIDADHRLAFVYFALVRKYGDMVPHAMATLISDGLKRLSELNDPNVREKFERWAERRQDQTAEDRVLGGGLVGYVDLKMIREGLHLMWAVGRTALETQAVKTGLPIEEAAAR